MNKYRYIIVSCVAICAIMTMTLYALSCGINGVMLKTSFSVIGGIAGYNIHQFNKKGVQ